MEEEVGSSEVGSSGESSLSEKVVLGPLAVEAGAVKESSKFLPSRAHQFRFRSRFSRELVVLGLSVPRGQVRSGFTQ